MIKIKYLAQFSAYIPDLSQIWIDTIGKEYFPDTPKEVVQQKLETHLNQDILPLAYVALDDDIAIGMCSLRIDDGSSRNQLYPWLGSLCVKENYRKRGIGKLLIDVVKSKAYKMGFRKLYLSALDKKTAEWYSKIGWNEVDRDIIDGKKATIMMIPLKP